MIVRFGFVAMSVTLQNASPSRTMTYASFSKLEDRAAAIRKLERLTAENLHNALRVLRHAYAHDIRLYRFSSKIIPLATHDALAGWDPYAADVVQEGFREVGRFVREKGIRASFHPDHFCVLNTPKPEVFAKSVDDLNYHVRMLEAMELGETAKCNLHVGGAYGDKDDAGERFVRQFEGLDARYRHRITLENDDKTFTAAETLAVAEGAGVPMVLDIHHHAVNDGGLTEDKLLADLWPRIVASWVREETRLAEAGQAGDAAGGEDAAGDDPSGRERAAGDGLAPKAGRTDDPSGRERAAIAGPARPGDVLPPKVHASSPKPGRDPKAHADHVEPAPLLRFLRGAAGSCPRLDVMIEAKRKDEALFRLMDDLRDAAKRGEGVRIVDDATLEITE